MIEELTPEERRAVTSLKRLAKRWPNSLWLFSASGDLCVMKADHDGERKRLSHGGVDPDYLVTSVNIPNDGGDW